MLLYCTNKYKYFSKLIHLACVIWNNTVKSWPFSLHKHKWKDNFKIICFLNSKKEKSKKLYKRPFCLPRFFLTIKKKQFYNSLLIRKELNELVKANTSFDWDLSPNLKLTMSLWHEMKEDRLFGVFISYLQLNLIRFFAYLQISVQHKKIWACK